jgi:hypothetical protein
VASVECWKLHAGQLSLLRIVLSVWKKLMNSVANRKTRRKKMFRSLTFFVLIDEVLF